MLNEASPATRGPRLDRNTTAPAASQRRRCRRVPAGPPRCRSAPPRPAGRPAPAPARRRVRVGAVAEHHVEVDQARDRRIASSLSRWSIIGCGRPRVCSPAPRSVAVNRPGSASPPRSAPPRRASVPPAKRRRQGRSMAAAGIGWQAAATRRKRHLGQVDARPEERRHQRLAGAQIGPAPLRHATITSVSGSSSSRPDRLSGHAAAPSGERSRPADAVTCETPAPGGEGQQSC